MEAAVVLAVVVVVMVQRTVLVQHFDGMKGQHLFAAPLLGCTDTSPAIRVCIQGALRARLQAALPRSGDHRNRIFVDRHSAVDLMCLLSDSWSAHVL